MGKSYAVLPCNGLDKSAGCLSREIALLLAKNSSSQIICPVFYRVADGRYNKLAEELPLLVIDGCQTRCATKLATEKGLKIAEKINLTDAAKQHKLEMGSSLELGEKEKQLALLIADQLLADDDFALNQGDSLDFPKSLSYEIYKKDKFIFRLPTDTGFLFNENDVWGYVAGTKARIGITDYMQKSLSDIMFFTPPAIGEKIEQFDQVGAIESGKAVFEIVSPFSGVVTAINHTLIDTPELINENPYEKGWIAEIELSDFEGDKELLHNFSGYFPILKRKVDDFHI